VLFIPFFQSETNAVRQDQKPFFYVYQQLYFEGKTPKGQKTKIILSFALEFNLKLSREKDGEK